jgi:translation initiation factor IF-3
MQKRGGRGSYQPKRGPEHKINEYIRVPEVRLTGNHPHNHEEKFSGEIMDTREALKLARDLEADLILINEKSGPPIAQIAEYQKFLYNIKKRKKEQESNTKKTEIKELRLGPNTDEHDLAFKTKNAITWLAKGDKVKAIVFFKGRNIIHKDRGEVVLLKLADALSEYAIPENMPKLDGKKMYIFFKPRPTK